MSTTQPTDPVVIDHHIVYAFLSAPPEHSFVSPEPSPEESAFRELLSKLDAEDGKSASSSIPSIALLKGQKRGNIHNCILAFLARSKDILYAVVEHRSKRNVGQCQLLGSHPQHFPDVDYRQSLSGILEDIQKHLTWITAERQNQRLLASRRPPQS